MPAYLRGRGGGGGEEDGLHSSSARGRGGPVQCKPPRRRSVSAPSPVFHCYPITTTSPALSPVSYLALLLLYRGLFLPVPPRHSPLLYHHSILPNHPPHCDVRRFAAATRYAVPHHPAVDFSPTSCPQCCLLSCRHYTPGHSLPSHGHPTTVLSHRLSSHVASVTLFRTVSWVWQN